MNKILNVTIAILAISTTIKGNTATEDNVKDCANYKEAWRIAKCAASQAEIGAITNKAFSNYLHIALRALPADS